jgi:hypothetical protein
MTFVSIPFLNSASQAVDDARDDTQLSLKVHTGMSFQLMVALDSIAA